MITGRHLLAVGSHVRSPGLQFRRLGRNLAALVLSYRRERQIFVLILVVPIVATVGVVLQLGQVVGPSFPWVGTLVISASVAYVIGFLLWTDAMIRTYRLGQMSWFISLLVVGLLCALWPVMLAYILAGPAESLDAMVARARV